MQSRYYDAHTLKGAIEEARKFTGWTPKETTTVHRVGPRKKKPSRSLRKWFKRRVAIEPIIGHLKEDNRMNRNHYKGAADDAVNATIDCGGI